MRRLGAGPKYFAFREYELDGIPFILARSGWSKQGGLNSIFVMAARVRPCGTGWQKLAGLMALAPVRPTILNGWKVDWCPTAQILMIGQTRLSWGWTVHNVDQPHDFVGKSALRGIRDKEVSRRFMGLLIEANICHHQRKLVGSQLEQRVCRLRMRQCLFGARAIQYRRRHGQYGCDRSEKQLMSTPKRHSSGGSGATTHHLAARWLVSDGRCTQFVDLGVYSTKDKFTAATRPLRCSQVHRDALPLIQLVKSRMDGGNMHEYIIAFFIRIDKAIPFWVLTILQCPQTFYKTPCTALSPPILRLFIFT